MRGNETVFKISQFQTVSALMIKSLLPALWFVLRADIKVNILFYQVAFSNNRISYTTITRIVVYGMSHCTRDHFYSLVVAAVLG